MEDKRDRLLAAAERLFVDRGFARASTKRIAAEAGVAEGTIYLYFENKADLLFHVFLRTLKDVVARIGAAARPDAPVADNLASLAGRARDLLVEKSALRVLFDREVALLPEPARHRLREEFGRLEDRFAAVFDWGKGRGELRLDVDTRLMSHVFMAALEKSGMLLEPGHLFSPADPAEARRTVDAILSALPALLLQGIARRPGG